MLILALASLQVVPTGLQHGTITAVIDHEPYEITTLRIDTDHDGAFVTLLCAVILVAAATAYLSDRCCCEFVLLAA